jgi:DNA-binding GntR family transcriptional regulator
MTTGKYVPLADILRKNIFSGKYGSEGGLPAASDLAKQHKLALNTVKTALVYLQGEGIIVKRNLNYYVNQLPITMTQYSPPSHVRFADGYNKNQEDMERVLLPDYLAEKLRTPQVLVVYRMQIGGENVEGVQHPLQISRRYYFLSISDEKFKRMQDDATYDPMWEMPANLVSLDEVSSRPATPEELAHLNLAKATSVLSLLEVIRDTQGNILMAQEITLAPRTTLCFEFPFENKPVVK